MGIGQPCEVPIKTIYKGALLLQSLGRGVYEVAQIFESPIAPSVNIIAQLFGRDASESATSERLLPPAIDPARRAYIHAIRASLLSVAGTRTCVTPPNHTSDTV